MKSHKSEKPSRLTDDARDAKIHVHVARTPRGLNGDWIWFMFVCEYMCMLCSCNLPQSYSTGKIGHDLDTLYIHVALYDYGDGVLLAA